MNAIRRIASLLPLFTLVIAGACTEKLNSIAGCPDLCTGQGAPIQTLIIEPVTLDTTVTAAGEFATEAFLFVGNRGDTVDTRAIVRFDTVPSRYAKSNITDSVDITTVDSAFITVRIDRRGSIVPNPVIIDAYDVDGTDPTQTDVAALFTASRLIGTRTIAKDSLKDSLRIPISNAVLLDKARNRKRLRVGIKARNASTQFGIFATETGAGAHVTFRATTDTAIRALVVLPKSGTPVNDVAKSTAFQDYTLAVKVPAPGPASGINVGGYPARLAYLRFTIPQGIVDSSIVVRARLILTQIPNTQLGLADTVTLIPLVGAAAGTVSDISRAARITLDRNVALIDSVLVPVRESGLRRIEIAVALQAWRLQSATTSPHVLVLRSGAEGVSIAEARFYSMEAAPNLRPRLEISYTPRTSFGRP
ncbi:MAG: hypothetical protein H0W69_00960 [Gemmatimonadaceae bacterium]|nr:hypothetical protein [Gemmatimonadaceae bacterium]